MPTNSRRGILSCTSGARSTSCRDHAPAVATMARMSSVAHRGRGIRAPTPILGVARRAFRQLDSTIRRPVSRCSRLSGPGAGERTGFVSAARPAEEFSRYFTATRSPGCRRPWTDAPWRRRGWCAARKPGHLIRMIFLARRGHPMRAERTSRLWRQAGLHVPRRRVATRRPRPRGITSGSMTQPSES